MNDQNNFRLSSFASLRWYDEVIKFVFNFVTKTSELLLAVGIIVSTANFLTDGHVMHGNQGLSDAWSWAQAIAIDSSLGIVFMNALQSVRERDKVKAVIFFILTLLLATVAGLITHFDALSHASGLPVTDKGVSGILPLWVMTALRSVAVIGFLLSSRLKHVSFSELRQDWTQGPISNQGTQQGSEVATQIDYTMLATALVSATQQTGAIQHVSVVEQKNDDLLSFNVKVDEPLVQEPVAFSEVMQDESTEVKIAHAYNAIKQERATQPNDKPISARELAKRANIRRSTCTNWLEQNEATHIVEEGQIVEHSF